MTNGSNDEETRYAWARRPPVGGEPASRHDEEPAAPGATTSPLSTEATTPQPVAPQPVTPQPVTPQPAAQGWTSPQATAVQDRPGPTAPPAPPAPPSGFGPFGGPGYQPTSPEQQTRPEYGPGYAPGYTPAAPTPPGPPNVPGGEVHRPREPRRPGWGGVVGVGVGAALLSSLLTAGLIAATTGTTTTSSSSGSGTKVAAPVTTSTAENPDWTAVAAAVEPSVVAVTVSSQSASGEGSGVILSQNGEILTNNHVATGAGSDASIGVVLSDGREYEASVVGTDSRTDLAVIKIKNPPSDLTPATLGSSSAIKTGDPVMAVGNPLGMQNTVTTGIVSNTDAPVTTSSSESEQQDQNPFGGGSSGSSASEQVYTNAIQTDAAINPGNSGGALVDAQGRVIGIPSSIASLGSSSFGSSESGSIGIGFAIPIDEAKTVADQLAKGQDVKHSYLGVGLADGEVQVDGASREAAVLKQVTDGGPAAKAGLKVNDAITAVDGDAVNSYASLVGQLQERQPGTSVTLTVVRDGKSQQIAVTLGTRPTTSS